MSEQSTTPGITKEASPTPGISIDRAVLRSLPTVSTPSLTHARIP